MKVGGWLLKVQRFGPLLDFCQIHVSEIFWRLSTRSHFGAKETADSTPREVLASNNMDGWEVYQRIKLDPDLKQLRIYRVAGSTCAHAIASFVERGNALPTSVSPVTVC